MKTIVALVLLSMIFVGYMYVRHDLIKEKQKLKTKLKAKKLTNRERKI